MSDAMIAMTVAAALVFWLNGVCAFLILIGHRRTTLGVVASIAYAVVAIGVLFVGGGLVPSFPTIMFLMLVFGWFVYAHRRYTEARQDELFQVIATAAESRLPLAPAVAAYYRDRPREGKKFWDALLTFVFPPGYLLWVQRQLFDDRAARLAGLLAAGAPLPDALRIVRGAASREVRIAAEVGDTTGRLAACLRRADRDRLAGVWLEIIPRVVYPLMILLFVSGITMFLMVNIAPKLKRIFDDFGYNLPWVTLRLFDAAYVVADYGGLVVLAILGMAGLAAVLILSPWVRWWFPIIGRLTRWEAQGLVFRMLGALIDVGRPAPEALGLLADTPDVPAGIRPPLARARLAVSRGESLAVALRGAGILPRSMVGFVQSSERLRTLPFALTELGDVLSGRAVRIARRVSFVVGPLLVVGVGLVVGFIAIGMFLPLVDMLTRLTV
jgi:type IV pilus assembly protein PilC